MTLKPWLVACIAIFAATPALAQPSSATPLNLTLPLQFAPAAASTAHGTAKAAPASKTRRPGALPDETHDIGLRAPYAYLPACDNKAYKRPRVFGGVGLGVFSGSDIEGNYQTGTVSIAKALGTCIHPSGGITFTFGFGRETINGRYWPG